MKFLYGKSDFRTQRRAEENGYLLTNGLGGFSSCTAANSVTRNDHAVLMASLKAPNVRWNLVHRLQERLVIGENAYMLSTQSFAKGEPEEGYHLLTSFSFEDYPVWRFKAEGVEVTKTLVLQPGKNTASVAYEITNRGRKDCRLEVVPRYQFVPKGQDVQEDQTFAVCKENADETGKENHQGAEGGASATISSRGVTLRLFTDFAWKETEQDRECCFYADDICDGRRGTGVSVGLHGLQKETKAGCTDCAAVTFSTEKQAPSFAEIRKELCEERALLAKTAGFSDPTAEMLAKSAGQYIAYRASTGSETILAGYPFFEDWGRDTMIAVTGCCIATGRYETAKSILRTFAAYEDKGLMPNLFPEGGQEPMYNTVDAALLFINSVYLYEKASRDESFAEEVWQVMEHIIQYYKEGTLFGIHMDSDALMMAGEGLDQVTWMDVRVGEILPTPRHGKPVEINAYWYNALRIMELLAPRMGKDGSGYGALAEQVKKSFREKFWLEEKQCLKDVLSGTKSDEQIRCNQIWAVSLPFAMLAPEQEQAVVRTVYEKLYTPLGLRTLAPEDEEFQPFYGGEQLQRDLAYHQGTVWVFPMGGYYLAYLKVHGYSEEAKETVRKQLSVLESALREGCAGQLPEIYDGADPTVSKGCFAQAWSVGEILRVYKALETETPQIFS